MNGIKEQDTAPSREQEMFWNEFVQLKADSCYVREYRLADTKWVRGIATIRAVTSTGSIAAWAVWRQYAFVWGFLIALSQVADALKRVFPFEKRRSALGRWSRRIDVLFVGAQRDWEEIASGRCTNDHIRRMLHLLRSQKQRAEAKYVPDGLPRKAQLFEKAEAEAAAFFETKYHSLIE